MDASKKKDRTITRKNARASKAYIQNELEIIPYTPNRFKQPLKVLPSTEVLVSPEFMEAYRCYCASKEKPALVRSRATIPFSNTYRLDITTDNLGMAGYFTNPNYAYGSAASNGPTNGTASGSGMILYTNPLTSTQWGTMNLLVSQPYYQVLSAIGDEGLGRSSYYLKGYKVSFVPTVNWTNASGSCIGRIYERPPQLTGGLLTPVDGGAAYVDLGQTGLSTFVPWQPWELDIPCADPTGALIARQLNDSETNASQDVVSWNQFCVIWRGAPASTNIGYLLVEIDVEIVTDPVNSNAYSIISQAIARTHKETHRRAHYEANAMIPNTAVKQKKFFSGENVSMVADTAAALADIMDFPLASVIARGVSALFKKKAPSLSNLPYNPTMPPGAVGLMSTVF